MERYINGLIGICNKGQYEDSYTVYLKNAVKVGENKNGDILCTYIYRHYNPFYNEDNIVINVILNEKKDELYGKDYDFELISFKKEFDFKPTFIKGMKDNLLSKGSIKIFDNALELILDELYSTGDEWIDYQREINIRSRFYCRNAQFAHNERFKSHYKELTWEQRKDWQFVQSEQGWLMWRRPINFPKNTLKEMNELGEDSYNKKMNEQNKIMIDILNEILEEKNI